MRVDSSNARTARHPRHGEARAPNLTKCGALAPRCCAQRCGLLAAPTAHQAGLPACSPQERTAPDVTPKLHPLLDAATGHRTVREMQDGRRPRRFSAGPAFCNYALFARPIGLASLPLGEL